MRSRFSELVAVYVIGVYSKRNLFLVLGRATMRICLNVLVSIPRSVTKSIFDPMIPSDSLVIAISGEGNQRNPPISTW